MNPETHNIINQVIHLMQMRGAGQGVAIQPYEVGAWANIIAAAMRIKP